MCGLMVRRKIIPTLAGLMAILALRVSFADDQIVLRAALEWDGYSVPVVSPERTVKLTTDALAAASLDATRAAELQLCRGNARWMKHDVAGAIDDFRAVLKRRPNDREASWRLGLLLMRHSKGVETDRFIEQLPVKFPRFAPARYVAVAHKLPETSDARIRAFSSVLALDPRFRPALLARALEYFRKDDCSRALRDLDESLHSPSDWFIAPHQFDMVRGACLLKVNQLAAAFAFLMRSWRTQAANIPRLPRQQEFGLAAACFDAARRVHQFAVCALLGDRMASLKPNDSKVWAQVSLAAAQTGWSRSAVNLAKRAVALDKSSAEAWYALAIACECSHDYVEAVKAYRTSLKLRQAPDTWLRILFLTATAPDATIRVPASVLPFTRKLVLAGPDSIRRRAYTIMAIAEAEQGEFSRALDAVRQAVKLGTPSSDERHYFTQLRTAFKAKRRFTDDKTLMASRAAFLPPMLYLGDKQVPAEAHVNVPRPGVCLGSDDLYCQFVSDWTGYSIPPLTLARIETVCSNELRDSELVESKRTDLLLRRAMARSMMSADNQTMAIADYRAVLARRPDDPEAGWRLAMILAQREEGRIRNTPGEASKLLEDLIRKSPKFGLGYFARGYAHLLKRRVSAAQADFDKAAKLKPEFSPTYMMRAECRLEAEDFKQAIVEIQRAETLPPTICGFRGHTAGLRARVFLQQGRYELAYRWSMQCLKLGDESSRSLKVAWSASAATQRFATCMLLARKISAIEGDAAARRILVLSFALNGNAEKAVASAKQNVDANPRDGDDSLTFAMALEFIGRYQQAADYYKRTSDVSPSAEATLRHAMLLAACPDDSIRNGRRAHMLLQGIKETSSSRLEMSRRIIAAIATAERGDFESAARQIANCISIRPDSNSDGANRLQKLHTLFKNKKPYRARSKRLGAMVVIP